MYVFSRVGWAGTVGQEACGAARQDKRNGLVLLGSGYNGRAYRKTSAYLCSAILRKTPEQKNRTRKLEMVYNIICNWALLQNTYKWVNMKNKDKAGWLVLICGSSIESFTEGLIRYWWINDIDGILILLSSWFWDKCWNQCHGFGKNVEINDMVLGAGAKWSELCGAKTPMMQRKGDKSQGGICFYKYTKTTTYIHIYTYTPCINLNEGELLQIKENNIYGYLIYISCIHHAYFMYTKCIPHIFHRHHRQCLNYEVGHVFQNFS